MNSVSLSIEWLLVDWFSHEATEEENCQVCTKAPRVWSLKDEETARLFTHEMAARNDEVTKADDIQKKWLLMKETWLKGSKQVCGMTKGPPWHKETWWWNRDVEKMVAKRKVCHKAWGNLNRLKINIL